MSAQAALNTLVGSAAGFPPPPKRRKCDIDSDEENDWEWERLDAAIPEYANAMIAAQRMACDHLPEASRELARGLGLRGPEQRITLPNALQARARMLLDRGALQQTTVVEHLSGCTCFREPRVRCCAAWSARRPPLAGCAEPACEYF